jgi:hypothetical protein
VTTIEEKKAAIVAAFGMAFAEFQSRHPKQVEEWLRQQSYNTIDDWTAQVLDADPALVAATAKEISVAETIKVVVPMILKMASAFFPPLAPLAAAVS